jgi:hypothetical protein
MWQTGFQYDVEGLGGMEALHTRAMVQGWGTLALWGPGACLAQQNGCPEGMMGAVHQGAGGSKNLQLEVVWELPAHKAECQEVVARANLQELCSHMWQDPTSLLL